MVDLAGSDSFWQDEEDHLFNVLYPEIDEAIGMGVLEGGALIGAAELGVDFDLVNKRAVEFAQLYSYELVKQIDYTTVNIIQNKVGTWIQDGKPLGDLVKGLENDNGYNALFSPHRARLIAITETTRAFAEGNVFMWELSGHVEGLRWMTVNDPNVDALCRANKQVGIIKLGDVFPSGATKPPAHPGCRCYLKPVLNRGMPTPGADAFRERTSTAGHQFMMKEYRGWGEGLTAAEDSALQGYRGFTYTDINKGLRQGTWEGDNAIRGVIQELDSAVAKGRLSENIVGYRGTTVRAFPEGIEVGKSGTDLAFASMSMDEKIATKFAGFGTPEPGDRILMKVKAPKGTPAGYMDVLGKEGWEKELLLGRGQTFKIIEDLGMVGIDVYGDGVLTQLRKLTVEIVKKGKWFRKVLGYPIKGDKQLETDLRTEDEKLTKEEWEKAHGAGRGKFVWEDGDLE